jgi:hypothetical protein
MLLLGSTVCFAMCIAASIVFWPGGIACCVTAGNRHL